MLTKEITSLPTVEIKGYNVMIHGKKFFDQPVKYGLRTYKNIQNIATAAAATDAAIHKKKFGSSTTTFIISNEEMNNIIKIIKSFEELVKGVSKKQLKMKLKNKKDDLLVCY